MGNTLAFLMMTLTKRIHDGQGGGGGGSGGGGSATHKVNGSRMFSV